VSTTVPGLRVPARCRVILDNDWAGDPDGLVALAHHLLSPANRVDLVTSSFLNPAFDSPDGAARGADLVQELVELIAPERRPRVAAGAEEAIAERPPSAAAGAIVAEARRTDDLPLLLVCGGPLTNVAEALRLAPDIATGLTLVWVGGAAEDRGFEYNRDTDRAAAEAVLGTGALAVWSFPLETYERCAYGVAELEHDLRSSGVVGAWLWERFKALPMPEEVPLGGTWALGDSPPVLVTALTDASSTAVAIPGGPGERRQYTSVDFRLIVGDLLARTRSAAQQGDRRRRRYPPEAQIVGRPAWAAALTSRGRCRPRAGCRAGRPARRGTSRPRRGRGPRRGPAPRRDGACPRRR